MTDPSAAPASRAGVTQWESMLARYPLASPWGLVLQIGGNLFANGLVVWLILSGRMTPFELVLLVALEAVLLIGIAWAQKHAVPASAIEANPMGRREKLQTFAFLMVWLGGAYAFVFLGFVPSTDEMLAAVRDPGGFFAASAIKWPLAITLATAAVDTLQDHAHWRRHGGLFYSTPGFQGAARMLTLILGGIPFAVPFFGLVIGLKLAGEKAHAAWVGRQRNTNRDALVTTGLALGAIVVVWLSLHAIERIDRALQGGVDWWALCYGAAKFVSELFIVCLPLIASKARDEEREKVAKPDGPARPKKKRLP